MPSTPLPVRLPIALEKRLKEIARELGVPLQRVVRQALCNACDSYDHEQSFTIRPESEDERSKAAHAKPTKKKRLKANREQQGPSPPPTSALPPSPPPPPVNASPAHAPSEASMSPAPKHTALTDEELAAILEGPL